MFYYKNNKYNPFPRRTLKPIFNQPCRCKTGSFDLQNVAINRHQSLMYGLVYRCSPLYVVPIHAKLESCVCWRSADFVRRFWHPQREIGRVWAVRCKIAHCPIKAAKRSQF
jgi:hypothetical protein